jgi:cytochrome c nitrite reductase small subunit
MNIRDIIKKYGRWYFIAAAAVLFASMALAVPYYMVKTGTPEYCVTCHVMETEYESWFYSGAHKQISCIDCHLPNDNFVNHYLWKGLDGMKDVIYFYTGLVPDLIHPSSHAKKTIKVNCRRCHEEMVSRIGTEDMQCWDCHRNLYHNM